MLMCPGYSFSCKIMSFYFLLQFACKKFKPIHNFNVNFKKLSYYHSFQPLDLYFSYIVGFEMEMDVEKPKTGQNDWYILYALVHFMIHFIWFLSCSFMREKENIEFALIPKLDDSFQFCYVLKVWLFFFLISESIEFRWSFFVWYSLQWVQY